MLFIFFVKRKKNQLFKPLTPTKNEVKKKNRKNICFFIITCSFASCSSYFIYIIFLFFWKLWVFFSKLVVLVSLTLFSYIFFMRLQRVRTNTIIRGKKSEWDTEHSYLIKNRRRNIYLASRLSKKLYECVIQFSLKASSW